jgi:DNA (cytosine-5)-methyltransferase 1
MQISLFDGNLEFKIDKPIRLIELFAGYGSQSLALKYLGVPFEHHRIAEWTIKSTQAYKDLHFENDNTDYSKKYSVEYLIDYLFEKGVSQNYSEPMTKEQIKRLGEEKIRIAYNNIIATHNIVSVCTAKGKDLGITDTDKYCYIMTYSFPCTDLSNAGKGLGMAKGSGTRSGLLWEVERLLDECIELPYILLMENVPQVIGQNNIQHFAKWIEKLEQLGYKNKWQVLNAKDFEIPQNRERCFMVSILGDYYYDFPKTIPLTLRLKDMLEDNVDESFYLSERAVKGIENTSFSSAKLENRTDKGGGMPNLNGERLQRPKTCNRVAYDEQNQYVRKDGCVGTLTTDGSSPKHNNRIIEYDT